MKRYNLRGVGKYLDGYTIVEVMIFLAISAALLFSASALISGRQQRTQFNQSVVQLDQDLQDLFNDVATGYYPTQNGFECHAEYRRYLGHFVPVITDTKNIGQGKNSGCTFTGKLITMPLWKGPDRVYGSPNNKIKDEFWAQTMVSTKEVDLINYNCVLLLGGGHEASPRLPGIREVKKLGAGLEIMKVVAKDQPNPARENQLLGGFAVVSDFAGTTELDNAKTGNSARIKLYGYGSTNSGTRPESTENVLINKEHFFEVGNGHITVCARQDGTGRQAALIVYANLSVTRQIDQWPSECN